MVQIWTFVIKKPAFLSFFFADLLHLWLKASVTKSKYFIQYTEGAVDSGQIRKDGIHRRNQVSSHSVHHRWSHLTSVSALIPKRRWTMRVLEHKQTMQEKPVCCMKKESGSDECCAFLNTYSSDKATPPPPFFRMTSQVSHAWLCGFFGMHPGLYEGMLWKKSKENGQYLKRKFVLAEREFTLSYYNKENVRSWHERPFFFTLVLKPSPSSAAKSILKLAYVSPRSRNPKVLKRSSPLRTSTPCSSLRRWLILTGCRSPSRTTDPPGTSMFTTRAQRWGRDEENILHVTDDLQTSLIQVILASFLLLSAGNSFMVQRHPRCSLCVLEDCLPCRERWGSKCLCVCVHSPYGKRIAI